MYKLEVFPILGLVLVAACGLPSQGDSAAANFTEADRIAIDALISDRVSLYGGTEDWSEPVELFYRFDAVLMPPNTSVARGREEIARYLETHWGLVGVVVNEGWTVEGVGDVAWVEGWYEWIAPGPDGRLLDRGKYLQLWGRQSDRGWRIVREIFSSDLPVGRLQLVTEASRIRKEVR